MLSLQIKDSGYRKVFFKREKFKIINKFLFINLLSKQKFFKIFHNKSIKTNLFFFFLKLQKQNKISKIQIKSRCILSNRGRSVNKYNGLARIKLREFMQFGILSGYTKSSW